MSVQMCLFFTRFRMTTEWPCDPVLWLGTPAFALQASARHARHPSASTVGIALRRIPMILPKMVLSHKRADQRAIESYPWDGLAIGGSI